MFAASLMLFAVPAQFASASSGLTMTNDFYHAISTYYNMSGCESVSFSGGLATVCTTHSGGVANVEITYTLASASSDSKFSIENDQNGTFTISAGSLHRNVSPGATLHDPSVSYSFPASGGAYPNRGSGSGTSNTCGGLYVWSSSSSIAFTSYSLSWSGPKLAGDITTLCLPIAAWAGTSWSVTDNYGFSNSNYFAPCSGQTNFNYPYFTQPSRTVSVVVGWTYIAPG